MNPSNSLDSSIPMLTEVIAVDDPDTRVFPVISDTQNVVLPATSHSNVMDEKSWEELEKTLRENVLRQLLTRADFVLEHRVRDGLADVLQTAVDGLAQEIRQGLSKSLEELIQRTVSQEISKIQSTNIKS
jgi:hypothetical protein